MQKEEVSKIIGTRSSRVAVSCDVMGWDGMRRDWTDSKEERERGPAESTAAGSRNHRLSGSLPEPTGACSDTDKA